MSLFFLLPFYFLSFLGILVGFVEMQILPYKAQLCNWPQIYLKLTRSDSQFCQRFSMFTMFTTKTNEVRHVKALNYLDRGK